LFAHLFFSSLFCSPILLCFAPSFPFAAGDDELGADTGAGGGVLTPGAAGPGQVTSGGLFTALPKEMPEYLFDVHQLSSDVDKGAKLVFINRSIETLACAEFGDLSIALQGDVKVRAPLCFPFARAHARTLSVGSFGTLLISFPTRSISVPNPDQHLRTDQAGEVVREVLRVLLVPHRAR
jgi:hypothetical protein